MKWRLTKRQLRILVLVGLGFTNEEIAQALGITHRTVQTHLTAVFARLGVKSRTQALVTLGWVTIPAQYLED
jgi:DNA-binding NarL/FixJ family response regulator